MSKAVQKEKNARATAVGIICEHLASDAFPDRLMEDVTTGHAFVMEVVYGTVRSRRALQWIIQRLVKKSPKPKIEAALLAGLYELFYMTGAEPYATVNEIVEVAKQMTGPKEAAFVNAVLRRAGREKDALLVALEGAPAAIRLSHPDILFRRWKRRFGDQATLDLCAWNNARANVVLRLRRDRTSVDAFLSKLQVEGVEATPHEYDPDQFLVMPRGVRVADLPGYKDGWFTVQDPATSLAVRMLDPHPGEKILDACASPGGKTLMIAEQMEGRGHLVALELHRDRLGRLRENLERAGTDFVRVVQGDASAWEGESDFDRILLDVPCSNTGVIRRRPDARWRFSEKRLDQLVRMQHAILDHGLGLLKPGGRLVYSTCSLEPEENEDLVRRCIAEKDSIELVETLQLFPSETHTDGAFAALIERARNS